MSAGGAERQASIICNHWIQQGHKVSLVTFENLPDHYQLDPRIKRCELRVASSRGQGLKLHLADHLAIRSAVAYSRPDMIVSFGDVVNIKILMAAGNFGVPIVVSERTVPSHLRTSRPGIHGWLLVLLRRLMYRRATLLVVQTRAVERWARRGWVARRTSVIPNVVAHGRSIGLHDRQVILTVGRMSPEKGHEVILEAFARIADRFPAWQLRMIGEGICRPALEARVRALRLEDRVEFAVPINNVSAEYETAGIFVLPSRYEGFPNALIEAMQAGCAVIASDCPFAPREILEEGVDGLLFANENPLALSQALERLIPDMVFRKKLGLAAQTTARKYLPQAVLPLWDRVLEDGAGKR